MNSLSADRLEKLGEAEAGFFGKRVLGVTPQRSVRQRRRYCFGVQFQCIQAEKGRHTRSSAPSLSAWMTSCPHGSCLGQDHIVPMSSWSAFSGVYSTDICALKIVKFSASLSVSVSSVLISTGCEDSFSLFSPQLTRQVARHPGWEKPGHSIGHWLIPEETGRLRS